MPFYDEVLPEKNRIDQLIGQGYLITGVKEDLSGAWLAFTHPGGEEQPVQLHILTADARVHFANHLLKQAQNS